MLIGMDMQVWHRIAEQLVASGTAQIPAQSRGRERHEHCRAPRRAYTAEGIYGQFVYVNPAARVVKASATKMTGANDLEP